MIEPDRKIFGTRSWHTDVAVLSPYVMTSTRIFSVRPSHSVSKYIFFLLELYFEAVSVKQNAFYHILHFPIPNYSKEKLLKAFMPAMLYFFIFWKEPLQQWCSTLSTPPLPVFPLLVFNKRLHTCRYRLCRFLILFMINRFM